MIAWLEGESLHQSWWKGTWIQEVIKWNGKRKWLSSWDAEKNYIKENPSTPPHSAPFPSRAAEQETCLRQRHRHGSLSDRTEILLTRKVQHPLEQWKTEQYISVCDLSRQQARTREGDHQSLNISILGKFSYPDRRILPNLSHISIISSFLYMVFWNKFALHRARLNWFIQIWTNKLLIRLTHVNFLFSFYPFCPFSPPRFFHFSFFFNFLMLGGVCLFVCFLMCLSFLFVC